MHTAFTLTEEMFTVEIDGQAVDRSALFAGTRHERIGVVVTTPLGGLGASFLVQLGITAYYDADRSSRLVNPHYPELYFFHAGGSFGEYSVLDAWPARKQVYLSDHGDELLGSINSHAITHLLLPDTMTLESVLGFAEPNAATDRLERCFLYHPSGRVPNGNISIHSHDPGSLEDITAVINLPDVLPAMVSAYPVPDAAAEHLDNEDWIKGVSMRMADIDPISRVEAFRVRDELMNEFGGTETYREISSVEAVSRFGHLRQN